MSKEAEARVRDELLQSLYAGMLRCTLAAPPAEAGEAIAAGVCANLGARDLLLLPRHGYGGAGFRVLRGLGAHPEHTPAASALAAGVVALPPDEAQAVSFALGAAHAAAHTAARDAGGSPLVCVVLPRAATLHTAVDRKPSGRAGAPRTWSHAGAYAARMGLPLLLVADRPRAAAPAGRRAPAPLFPSIPVDREDALALYRVAYECAARARSGGGPSLLACVPFRVAGQGPQAGGLARLEAMLRKRGVFQKAWHRRLERLLLRELDG